MIWGNVKGIGIAVLAVWMLPAKSPAQQPPASVRAVSAKSEVTQPTHRVIGSLRAISRAEIAAREAAALIEIPVREGDTVKKGDLLALQDTGRLTVQLAEAKSDKTAAEAALTRREAERDRAKQNYEMNRRLFENRTVAERERLDAVRDVDVSEAQLQEAKHALAQSESRINLLEVRLADLEIRAPFDGSIVAKHAETGEWLEPGDPVVTLVSDDLEAVFSVPERFAEAVRDHAEEICVSIASSDERIRSDGLKKVADIDTRSRTFPLIARILEPVGYLAAGMSVAASIPAGERKEHTLVPKDALLRSGDGAYVFRASDGDSGPFAEHVPVLVLFESGDEVAVQSESLKPGDPVIVEGNERLAPNRAIAVIADDATITMRATKNP